MHLCLMSSLTTSLDQHLAAQHVYWRRHRTFPAIADLTAVLGMFALPLVGPVRAGLPQPADAGQAPEALSVETFLLDHPDKTIYCQIKRAYD